MATDAASTGAPEAYDDLLAHYRRLAGIGDAAQMLRWDQQVTMPPGGTPARSLELSTLSGLHHELLTEADVGDWLQALEDADLDGGQGAVVREIRRDYERATRVPRSLVEEISATSSDALPVWENAREEDEFDAFAPYLEELIELKREYAEHVDPDRDPYEVLFEDYEPYLPLSTAERILGRLRDELVPMIEAVEDADVELPRPFAGGSYPTDAQEAFSRAVLDRIG